jgi:hypothetical protein
MVRRPVPAEPGEGIAMKAGDRAALATRLRALTAACALAAIAACSSDEPTCEAGPTPTSFLPRTSPTNLLHNLRQAYAERDLAEFDSLLAEDFTFFLSSDDQQNPDLPDSWRRASEILIHRRMFDRQRVLDLRLSYRSGDSAWDSEEGKYAVDVWPINLYLHGITVVEPPDTNEYRVSDSRSRFWFRKNPWLWPGTKDSVWTIASWQDNPTGGGNNGGSAMPATWGKVKGLFWSGSP